MSFKVENLEKNMAKLTITVPKEEMEKALEKAYDRKKGSISIPGFRKGKAPRAIIEKMYGKGVFLEEATNYLLGENYRKAADESGLDIVSRPEIDFVQVDPEKELIFTATVAVKPEVKLGEYKGLEVSKADLSVSDEEVDAKLKAELEKNGRTVEVTDRPCEKGDIVNIDFKGYVDGVAFEGGEGTGYPLELGSGTFIPGFEEQLEGKNVGDEVEVKVTFPADYHSAELAGKEAKFDCKINKIETKVLPELDDEFAKDVSEFETLAEYKESIKKELEKSKELSAKEKKQAEAIEKAIENATMEIPEAYVLEQANQMLDDFNQKLSAQGLSLDQYLQFTGQTREKFIDQMKPDALKRIQSSLVIEAIVAAENIDATEEEVNEELDKIAKMYKMEVEKIKEVFGEEQLGLVKKNIALNKAAELVANEAKEV